MFCPICRAEYRQGFNECSDCRVALVASLPAANEPSAAPASADPDAAEMLWSGYNRGLRDAIFAALDAADIPYADESREVSWLPAFDRRGPYEVWIMQADHDAASQALSEVLPDEKQSKGDEDDPAANSALEEPADSNFENDTESLPDDSPPEIDPDDATCQVWSGDDPDIAQCLSDCLRGVGIACVVPPAGDGNSRVLVLPDTEQRAREIVREVVDGTPPN